jgi:hypothetical protein
MNEPTQICRGFTDEQWKVLRQRLIGANGNIIDDEDAWCCAVEVFARRISERFLSCIEALEKADSRLDIDEVPPGAPADCSTLPVDSGLLVIVPGFAIMALCCLLIETLQSFRQATESLPSTKGPCSYPAGQCIYPRPTTLEHFQKFLRLPAFHGAFDNDTIAKSFCNGIRNGIFHEAETREWVIWRNDPENLILESRGDGYALNRTEFYLALKSEFQNYLEELRSPANLELRQRFLKKMNDVVKEC